MLGASGSFSVVAEHLGPERDRSADGPRVGVEQQLGGVAAHSLGRVPWSADPVPVRLARPHFWHERMPDVGVGIPQRDLRFRAVFVEQAQGEAFGDTGGDREVRAHLAEVLTGSGAERVDVAWHRLGGSGVSPSVRVRGDAGSGNRNGSLLSGRRRHDRHDARPPASQDHPQRVDLYQGPLGESAAGWDNAQMTPPDSGWRAGTGLCRPGGTGALGRRCRPAGDGRAEGREQITEPGLLDPDADHAGQRAQPGRRLA